MRRVLALLAILALLGGFNAPATAGCCKPPKIEKMLKPPHHKAKGDKKPGESYTGPQDCCQPGCRK